MIFSKNSSKLIIAGIMTVMMLMMAMIVPVSADVTTEAEVALAPKATAAVKIDGAVNDAVWTNATWYGVARRQEATTLNNTTEFATAWDDKNFYIAIKVVDDTIVTTNLNENIYSNDGVEIFLDPNNLKEENVYDDKTLHLLYQVADGKWTIWGGSDYWTDVKANFPGVQAKHALTDNGYIVEAVFPFADLGIAAPMDGVVMGLEVTNNDDDNAGSNAATDRGVLYWNEAVAADNPETWGSVCLYNKVKPVISYRGTPAIDGVISDNENWVFTSEKANASAGVSYTIASMCDVENLYLAIDITGEDLDGSSVSIFIDRDNERGGTNEEFVQIVDFSPSSSKSDYTRTGREGSFNYSPLVTSKSTKTSNGYSIEIQIAISEFNVKPEHLNAIGMEIDYFKTKGTYDATRTTWSQATSDSMWNSSLSFGSILLNNVNVAGGSNNAPTGNQLSSFSIAQGQKLSGKVTVTDPDGDPLTYQFDPNNNTPSKTFGTFELNETTGEWSYTPPSNSFLAPNGVNYYIQASDEQGATFHQRIEIRVEPTPTYKTYHVDGDTGKDSNDGSTHDKAMKTLQAAIDRVKPGDTIIVHESAVPYGYAEERTIKITSSGLPDAYITIKAADGEQPVINTKSTWNSFVILGSYIKIDGLTLKGQGHDFMHDYEERYEVYRRVANGEGVNSVPNSVRYQTNGLSVWPDNGTNITDVGVDKIKTMHHIEVRNCVVDGMAAAGMVFSICDYIVVENNTIINNCWGNMYGSSGISVLGTIDIDDNFGEHKIIVRNNITAGNRHFVPWISVRRFSDGNGIIIDSTNNKSTNNTLLAKGDKWGVLPYQGRFLVSNNLTYLNGGSGIHVFDGDNVDLINNTVYSNSSTPILGYSDFYASQANSINMYNNIVYSRTGAKMQISSSANSEVVYDNNLFYNYSSNNNLGQNIPGSRGKAGTTAGENNIYGKDPMFKNVYEINHDKGIPYPDSWTAEMIEFAKNGGYFIDADYSVSDLEYDFGLKEGSPALESGNKEWSDKVGNTENRMGIFGTVGSPLKPVNISDVVPITEVFQGEVPKTEPMLAASNPSVNDSETKAASEKQNENETEPDTETQVGNESETNEPDATDSEGSTNTAIYIIIGAVIGVGAVIAVILALKKSKAKKN